MSKETADSRARMREYSLKLMKVFKEDSDDVNIENLNNVLIELFGTTEIENMKYNKESDSYIN